LKNYVSEIERLNSKKDQLQAEIREVFDSAKSKGFEVICCVCAGIAHGKN
jgi:uncharacterized protein (UPF0335 family)